MFIKIKSYQKPQPKAWYLLNLLMKVSEECLRKIIFIMLQELSSLHLNEYRLKVEKTSKTLNISHAREVNVAHIHRVESTVVDH